MQACVNHEETPALAPCTSCQRPFCQACLVELYGFALCRPCREFRAAQPPPLAPTQYGVMDRVVPTRNPQALAAYYCGIFALIPLVGNLLGPAALVLGVVGMRRIAEMPGLPGRAHALTGVILGIITTLLYWGLAALILIGSFAR
jgi:hypothetical protein